MIAISETVSLAEGIIVGTQFLFHLNLRNNLQTGYFGLLPDIENNVGFLQGVFVLYNFILRTVFWVS